MKRAAAAVIVVLQMLFLTLATPPAGSGAEQDPPAQKDQFVSGEYFVGFQESVTADDEAVVKSHGMGVRRRFREARALSVVTKNPRRLAELMRHPRVEYVEPVPMRYPLNLSSNQLTPSLGNGLYGLVTTKAADAHQRGVTGEGINVGVADTGIDYTHPDIAPNYKGGVDMVGYGDLDPYWNNDPAETHGTHVAGTILAAANGAGVLGVAYKANLYHARVLGPDGGSSADIMQGVRWLVETAKCKVVNLSLGGPIKSRTEENFYKEMRRKGALIVAAAGNDGLTELSYPAGYAVNIAVGAVDQNNMIGDFSNRGKNIDVVAPGVNVLSAVPIDQGRETAVRTDATYRGLALDFAPVTSGVTRELVDCGMGKVGEFPAAVAGKIALIQRGDTTFAEKVTNAMDAGAAAAVIYNNVPGDFVGTLGAARKWIPAVTVSDAAGAALLRQAGASATVVNQPTSWDSYTGTSMAAPHVAGVIALIWSARPGLPNSSVENYLYRTCKDLGERGYDTTYGRGLVNASAAVARAGR